MKLIYLKILGSAILVFAAVGGASKLSALAQSRVEQIAAFLSLLRYIKAQVAYFKTPVNEIYLSFENSVLEKCGFISALRENGMISALENTSENLYIEKAERELLYLFACELGGSFKEEQVKSCDYYIESLQLIYTEQKAELPRKKKLYKTVFLTVGIMIIIMFL